MVSVIVPIYNVEPYLCDCLNSILAQTYTDLEIILVDDGSPDNCAAICDAYAAKDSRIRVIHKKNGGLSDARNVGLDAAKGKWIVFVDSDDLIAPKMIEVLVNACPNEDDLAAVDFTRFTNGEIPSFTGSVGTVCCSDLPTFISRRSGLYVWGILYNFSLIEKLHLRFDTSLSNLEDVAWNLVYLSHIKNMYFLSGPMYHYRHNPTSITSRCWDKHWQIRSWFMARNSVFRWFAREKHTYAVSSTLSATHRYCVNNIFAECIVGKLTYKDYAALRIMPPTVGITMPEMALEHWFPRLYFVTYLGLMKLRNLLHR